VPDVAHLDVVISADTRGFDAGIKHVETEAKGLGASVSSGIGTGIGFSVFEKGLSALAAGFGAAKGSVIDLNSSLEQSKIAFTTMLGSAQKADDFLESLAKFAAETPFEFPDLVNASKRMFAFGFAAKDVVPLLTAVGDAVAAVGGGADVIDGVTTALGQMQAKGKVSAEEMNQLAERGIPAWDMLAKKMGVSVAEAMDASAKGQVKAATMLAAFQEGSAARFGGMMAKQSKTFAGAMSTISDTLQMATARAFKPFFDMLSAGAVSVASFLSSSEFSGWADAATTAIGDLIASGMDLVAWLVDALRPAWEWVIDNADDIKAVFTGAAAGIGALLASSAVVPIIGAVGAALTALLSPIVLVAAAGAALALAWQHNWFGIRDVTASVVGWLTTTVWPGLLASMAILQTWITTTFVPTFQGVVTWLRDTLGLSLTWLTTTAWPGLQAAMTTVWSWTETTLVPSLTTVWTWLQTNLGGTLTWLATTAWPLMGQAANAVQNWFNETLVPTLKGAWSWLSEKIGDALTWLREKGWPLMGEAANKVQNWINETLIPTLSAWWTWLQERLSPIYQWFITYGWPKLQEAGAAVWSWLTTSLFPALSEWYDWLQARLSPIFSWFIDYGWPRLKEAGAVFWAWAREKLLPVLDDLWRSLQERLSTIFSWFITYGWPGMTTGAQNLGGMVGWLTEMWDAWNVALSKTDAAEHWVNILDNLGRFGRWLIDNVKLGDWFADVGRGIGESTGMLDYFAEMVDWILKWLDKLTSWLPGDRVPKIDEPPQAPGGSSGSGGGSGGSSPAPPSRAEPAPSSGGPGPSPTPSPGPPPVIAPTPPPVTPTPTPQPSGGGMPTNAAGWEALTRQMAAEYGLGSWFVNQIRQESGFNPDAVSPAGARGIGQFMPGTGAAVAAQLGVSTAAFWADPRLQLRGAALHMHDLVGSYDGDVLAGLVAYNAGSSNADYLRPFLHNVPKEIWELENTWRDKQPREYVRSILGLAEGGWAGLHGPELAWLGERGPEYVIPNHALGGGGAPESLTINVAVGGRVAEQIYVEGRDLAIRRGRAPAGVA
jgi:tape measure domain-containing protein